MSEDILSVCGPKKQMPEDMVLVWVGLGVVSSNACKAYSKSENTASFTLDRPAQLLFG